MRTLLATFIAVAVATPAIAQNQKDICETLKSAGQFNTLTKAIEAAGITDAFEEGKSYTLLAPTDEAFAKLPEGKLEELLKPENREKLAGLLKLHIIEKKITASEATAANGQSIPTCCPEGTKCMVKATGNQVAFSCGSNTAKVVKADIMASNGVIHAIDAVLMPPKAEGQGREN